MIEPTGRRVKLRLIALVPLALGAVIGVVLLVNWFGYDPTADWTESVPGRDGAPEQSEDPMAGVADVDIRGRFEAFDGTPADLPGTWPRFRGAAFDNICRADFKLSNRWPEAGPDVLWSVDLGEGHAAPAVWKGRVYLLDYDEERRADSLRCFSLADGREIWRRHYLVPAKRNHGLSRTVPAVTPEGVVTIGPRCHVLCVDAETGDFRWGIDLQKEYGTTEPLWFTGQCPLVEHGLAVLAPGGPDTLMMAVDCASGEAVWKTPNPNGWKMSHSSVMPMMFFDRKMYVYCAAGGIVAVAADGPDAGEVLWDLGWSAQVVAPSPVQLSGNRLFVTAGYGAGSALVQIGREGDSFTARIVAEHGPNEWLACEQQTPIYHDGLLYGVMPKDGGALKRQLVCYNPENGRLVWSSGKAHRFGLGPFIMADGKLFVLSDDGILTMVKVSRESYEPMAEARVLDGTDAWGPIAVAGTRMLVRDSKRMVCLEVGGGDR